MTPEYETQIRRRDAEWHPECQGFVDETYQHCRVRESGHGPRYERLRRHAFRYDAAQDWSVQAHRRALLGALDSARVEHARLLDMLRRVWLRSGTSVPEGMLTQIGTLLDAEFDAYAAANRPIPDFGVQWREQAPKPGKG